MLKQCAMGFGGLAFRSLAQSCQGLHHPAKAKSVIFLFMNGGVSQMESFDPKPELKRRHLQPAKMAGDKLSMGSNGSRKWLGPLWETRQHGQSGMWVSDLFPHIARRADDLCVVRSMVGETPLHSSQTILMHTGRSIGAAPSFGAWASYGLGSERGDLPGFIALDNGFLPNGGMQNYSSAFLPAIHQATLIRANGQPMDNIAPKESAALQRAKIAYLKEQDGAFAEETASSAVESAIRNYEMAAAMQLSVPELCEVKGESAATLKLYGVDRPAGPQRDYAMQCLRARRLVEAGVRFVEVTCPMTHVNNAPWDQHGELKLRHAENALITDQPVAALLHDLKARGLLDETIVLWAGEMGRTPHTANGDGRDHHVNGYSVWMAGGGIKGSTVYGCTDELGQTVAEHPTDIHDLHATMLHQLGMDHERLTYRHGGRDMRLTDVKGRVLSTLLS
jgi:hypothetical protein